MYLDKIQIAIFVIFTNIYGLISGGEFSGIDSFNYNWHLKIFLIGKVS